MWFGMSTVALIRLGKTYFAEAFALHEFHGNICAKTVIHLVSEIKQEAFANFSLRLLFKWLFIFFTTHRKIISNEVITGALSQRIILLLLGMFPILVTITSYKKYLYGRFFPLWKQITLTHLNGLEVFLCSSALIMHWNRALHFAEIRRTQTSLNI